MTPNFENAVSPEISGVMLINKSKGWTSHDVVAKVRRLARTRQVGHAGTLDPMAEGVLVVCIGSETRLVPWLIGLDKVYEGEITLGAISDTDDAMGNITPQPGWIPTSMQQVQSHMHRQCGLVEQLPPAYAAIKVAGRKLYDYARNGEEVPRLPRTVQIMRFELTHFDPPKLNFIASVGSGVYVRAMARDLGIALECGAYLSDLRRTRVGSFSLEHAIKLEALIETPEILPMHLLDTCEALGHLPKLTLIPQAERSVLHGRSFCIQDILEYEGTLLLDRPVLVLSACGRVLSIAQSTPMDQTQGMDENDIVFKPLRVLG